MEYNNHLVLVGKVTSDKKFSHEIYGESFYIFDLEVARLSGNSDIIPITISERLILEKELEIGDKVAIEGQFRSYNSYENEKNRLIVNRAYNKSDYIPAIAWGRNARFCQNIEVGTKVKITGRVQSRNYEKKFEDGTTQTRTAYEVSISSLEIVNEEEENKEVI